MLTPLERGRILHDLLQEGFEAWDAGSDTPRPITPETYEEALATFRDIAVKKIPPEHRRDRADPPLWRSGRGRGDRVALTMGARPRSPRTPPRRVRVPEPTPARDRSTWRETLVRPDQRTRRSCGHRHRRRAARPSTTRAGRAPDAAVTLQVPLYAMCLSQELGAPVQEAAYLSFRDRRPISRADFQKASALLVDTYGAIQRGEFSPKPHKDLLCYSCGFVGVCRKEIQEDA